MPKKIRVYRTAETVTDRTTSTRIYKRVIRPWVVYCPTCRREYPRQRILIWSWEAALSYALGHPARCKGDPIEKLLARRAK